MSLNEDIEPCGRFPVRAEWDQGVAWLAPFLSWAEQHAAELFVMQRKRRCLTREAMERADQFAAEAFAEILATPRQGAVICFALAPFFDRWEKPTASLDVREYVQYAARLLSDAVKAQLGDAPVTSRSDDVARGLTVAASCKVETMRVLGFWPA